MKAIHITSFEVIGRGVYCLSDAERLTKVPRQRIRRWAKGYSYQYKGRERQSAPIVAARLLSGETELVLDFADLLEVRFLNAFREHGVGWKAIRIAAARAKELLGRHHPFSSRIFMAISGIRNELSSISTCVERVARRFRLHGTCLESAQGCRGCRR